MDESIRSNAKKQNVVPRQIVQEGTTKNLQESKKTVSFSIDLNKFKVTSTI